MHAVNTSRIHLSVVSHGQSPLIAGLLADLDRHCREVPLHVTVTLNVPEPVAFDPASFRMPVYVRSNSTRLGFSANHNAAFRHGQHESPSAYFAVVNPDVRFSSDPFPALLACLEDRQVGIAAPLVVNAAGGVEDSARRFPTPLTPLLRVFGAARKRASSVERSIASPDWVAGMFMLMPSHVFGRIGGFDERYFLYYEDVDLCARLSLAGYEVRLCPNATVVHAARRQSHGDATYLRWHVGSMVRFFSSSVFLSITARRIAATFTGHRRS